MSKKTKINKFMNEKEQKKKESTYICLYSQKIKINQLKSSPSAYGENNLQQNITLNNIITVHHSILKVF